MFSSQDFDKLLAQVLDQLGVDAGSPKQTVSQSNDGCKCPKPSLAITPSNALVIAGLLTGVLDVDSVLVDRNQLIEIVLVGSLRRKTEADKLMDQIGPMPFDEVLRALKFRV